MTISPSRALLRGVLAGAIALNAGAGWSQPAAPSVPEPRAPSVAPSQTAAQPAPTAADDVGAGVFTRLCALCHGPEGGGGQGPRIAGRTDAVAVAQVVRNGQGQMPALSSMLSAAEIEAVASYVGRLPH